MYFTASPLPAHGSRILTLPLGVRVSNPDIIFVSMNYLDILLFVPLVYGGWRGFKKGLIINILDTFGSSQRR